MWFFCLRLTVYSVMNTKKSRSLKLMTDFFIGEEK